MNLLFLQPSAILSTLILALPPGWCGGFALDARDDPAAACCHQTAAAHPGDQGGPAQSAPPVQTDCECCCSWDALLAGKSDLPAGEASLFSSGGAHERVPASLGELPPAPVRSGPRLHVLKCVWRC